MSEIFLAIEIIGVISFAVSGAMVAIDKETDLFGVIFLSIITCFGGGITRDLLIGNVPPMIFNNLYLIAIAIVTSIAVFFIAMIFKRRYVKNEELISRINNYFDALGLGVFAVMGAKTCLDSGENSAFIIIVMGMITCIGGSMIRDFALKEIPFFLRKRIYCIAALLGAAIYYVLYVKLSLNEGIAMAIGALSVFVVRILATVFKLNVPKAIKFSELREDTATIEETDAKDLESADKREEYTVNK